MDFVVLGFKVCFFFNCFGGILFVVEFGLGDKLFVSDVVGVVCVMFKVYDEGKIDWVFLVFNDFVNIMI